MNGITITRRRLSTVPIWQEEYPQHQMGMGIIHNTRQLERATKYIGDELAAIPVELDADGRIPVE